MKNVCFKSLVKALFLLSLLAAPFFPTGVVAQSVTQTHIPQRQPDSCLRFDPEVRCDQNGVISVILHGVNPPGFFPDELEVTSMTPGVTVQPNYMSPVPANPSFILNGASIGQNITLMSNAVDIGAGSIQGSDLCCSGIVNFRIPRDICQQPDPDLEITKIRGKCYPWTKGSGHSCKFTVKIKNVGSGPAIGPLSVTDTYTAPSATVSNPSPPWMCTNNPASQSFTCNHPVTTVHPGQTVTLNYTLNVPGYRRGGRFLNCAELRPDLSERGQVALAQTLLNDAGYGAGTVDGVAGARTRAAVRACQAENGMPLTGDYRDFLKFIRASTTGDRNPGNNRSCVNVDLNPLPTPKVCPPGTTGTYPNCREIVKVCPPGTIGTYPDCREIIIKKCPPGTFGTYPDCQRIIKTCPEGTIGTWPNCRQIPVKVCPPGTTGVYPNCRTIAVKVCPPGTTGVYPNCRTIAVKVCPPGTVGTYPNCKSVVINQCPPGTTGVYPNCRTIAVKVCPPGTVGTYPNCKSVVINQCPPGTIGNWPICIKLN